MARVKFIGPPGLANVEVGAATGEGDFLEPDKVYDLPKDLAERLVESSSFWKAEGGNGGPTVAQLRERAGELGLDLPSKATKAEIQKAIAKAEDARTGEEAGETGSPAASEPHASSGPGGDA